MTSKERSALRKTLRQNRRQLTSRQQEVAAARLLNNVYGQRFFRSARRIAFYIASDGEIDPELLLAAALARGQHCYLPLIHPYRKNRLLFVRYRHGDPLTANRWGIYEPHLRTRTCVSARALDLVFVPLVGFDAGGNRLGMGKGFYDRTFAFRHHAQRRSPMLVGLAHECQKVGELDNEDWDVQMDKILSDSRSYQRKPIW